MKLPGFNHPLNLEVVTKHVTVSRAFSASPKWSHLAKEYPGLDRLRRLRVNLSNCRQAIRNAAEEAPLAARVEAAGGPGAAYEAGYITDQPYVREDLAAKRLVEAVAAGLPEDLRTLCLAWIAQQTAERPVVRTDHLTADQVRLCREFGAAHGPSREARFGFIREHFGDAPQIVRDEAIGVVKEAAREGE